MMRKVLSWAVPAEECRPMAMFSVISGPQESCHAGPLNQRFLFMIFARTARRPGMRRSRSSLWPLRDPAD